MRIEEGKYYLSQLGYKFGPMRSIGGGRFVGELGTSAWDEDGEPLPPVYRYVSRLVAEWSSFPVITETVTKTRIVPGTYADVVVGEVMKAPDCNYPNVEPRTQVHVTWRKNDLNADELDAAAAVLSALAKGLRDA